MKRMHYNSRERALSTDQEREQAFARFDQSEILRYLVDASSDLETVSGGVESLGGATSAPLRANVFSGLRARPLNGTTDLFITPGVVTMVNSDIPANPDDSPYKVIIDPGVVLSGALVLTPNASGSIRVDVIECSRVDIVLESDNRDIFNQATGLFAAVAVTKVSEQRLTYRIRLGTPGGGYPGNAIGWLPLAVAVVPNGATTWDHVTLWDVRPLVSDLVRQPLRLTHLLQGDRRTIVGSDVGVLTRQQHGFVEVVGGQRWAGGPLRSGPLAVPPAAATVSQFIDWEDANIQEPGFAFAASSLVYLWCCFPHGLPRWVRYSETTDGLPQRVPFGPRGVLVVSNKGPSDVKGVPAAITMPTATGLGGATTDVVMALATQTTAGSVARVVLSDGKVHHLSGAEFAAPFNPTSTVANTHSNWVLVDNVAWPANARALHLRFSFITTTGAGSAIRGRARLELSASLDGSVTTPFWTMMLGSFFSPASTGATLFSFEARVPMQSTFAARLGLQTRHIRLNHDVTAFAGATASNAVLEIMGWELGP